MSHKYRVWDKEKQEYFELIEGGPGCRNPICLQPDGRLFWFSFEGLTDVTDRFEIEFCAGSNDDDRRPIYGGDIIHLADDGNGRLGPVVVEWHKKGFWVGRGKGYVALEPDKEISQNLCMLVPGCKIIGNVRENPGLVGKS